MKTFYGFNIHDSYRTLPKVFYHDQHPLVFENPSMILMNERLAKDLNLDINFLKTKMATQFLLGNTSNTLIRPLSMAYAGHQYGQFTILGDGRAHLLLEHLSDKGLYDLHLKGSGPTSFSRGFDGRATLRSALLEYLMSEAMVALNIPTTQSLAVIKTGDQINRIGLQDAAVLVRVAQSHLRVGTFEYAIYKKDHTALKALADYAIKRHDDDLIENDVRYLLWYKRVIQRQAKLIAHWQSVGFVHGVMNTDNMTISGETIDYGPCAFINQYDLSAVYSSIDTYGRYAYGNQPYIGSWNLATLGQMILPLIDENHQTAIKQVQDALGEFGHYFEQYYYSLMAKKLGFNTVDEPTINLIDQLLKLMADDKADYTETFVALTYQNYPKNSLFESTPFKAWETKWQSLLDKSAEGFILMRQTNPVVIPRNHLVKDALDKATENNDLKDYAALLEMLKNPFNLQVPEIYRRVPKDEKPFITYCGT